MLQFPVPFFCHFQVLGIHCVLPTLSRGNQSVGSHAMLVWTCPTHLTCPSLHAKFSPRTVCNRRRSNVWYPKWVSRVLHWNPPSLMKYSAKAQHLAQSFPQVSSSAPTKELLWQLKKAHLLKPWPECLPLLQDPSDQQPNRNGDPHANMREFSPIPS